MELERARIEASPDKERVRLVGTVRYEQGDVRQEDLWLDVPARFEGELSRSGNCWLAFLLPLGAALGEPVRIGLPVDPVLLTNADRLLHIWSVWYPDASPVKVEAAAGNESAAPGAGRTAAFFSGGVDSFFTLLRPRTTAAPGHRRPIQDLLTLHGFDVPLTRRAEFQRMRARHQKTADALGMELLDLATNLRTTRWRAANWALLAHGAGLAGVALALEGRLGAVYIAGGGGYRGLHPWASHSVTDPLFSTSRTDVVYDAVEFLRTEKIEAIADATVVHDALHVCWVEENDANCGVCNKCLRTMLVLDVCGALSRCRTFPPAPALLDSISKMDCSYFADRRELEDIRAFALSRGRVDAARAIDRAVARTRRRALLRAPVAWARSATRNLLGAWHK